jgi:hypothetical protein
LVESFQIFVYCEPMSTIEYSEHENALQIAAINEKLSLSYEERIEAHENALQLINDLKKAKEMSDAESQSST